MPKEKLLNFSFEWELLEKCPLCSHEVLIPNGKVQWLEMDFWYVVCTTCGLKFMNPRPTQKSAQAFYRNLFWEQKIRNIGFHQPGQMWNTKRYKWDNEKRWNPEEGKKVMIEKHRELRLNTIVTTLSRFITLRKTTNLLEVGAGFSGTLRDIHEKFGSSGYVIEPSAEAQETLKSFGLTIVGNYAEDLEKLCRGKKKFDAIIFSHALENTNDPLQVIKWAKQCLTKNGIIYIQLSNLLTFDQMNPYHPYIFSAYALGFLAKKAGLKPHRAGEVLHRMLTMVFTKP
ncbi:MAG: class I SAM-dependent methyltransferase [Patescibacteria group bacterium]